MLNRRRFLGAGTATVASVGASLSLFRGKAFGAPTPASFRQVLIDLSAQAQSYFGSDGIGALSWFTPTGPNPPPTAGDFFGSYSFQSSMASYINTCSYVSSPTAHTVYNEIIQLYEDPAYASLRAQSHYGPGTSAIAFERLFAPTTPSDIYASLGHLVKVNLNGSGEKAIGTAVHLLGSLGLSTDDIVVVIDEVLGGVPDIRIVGDVTAVSDLTVTLSSAGAIHVHVTGSGATTVVAAKKKKKKKWSLGKILGFIGAVIIGSLIGGLIAGPEGAVAGGTLAAAIFLQATGGGFGVWSPPDAPCPGPVPFVLC